MNFNESAGQLFAFSVMAVCGIVLCLLYDGLGALRAKFRRWYVTVPCDIVFGAAAVVLYFVFHYRANYLKLSPFLLLAAALGFFLCKISLSRIVAKAGRVLYNILEKCLNPKGSRAFRRELPPTGDNMIEKIIRKRGKKHGERTEDKADNVPVRRSSVRARFNRHRAGSLDRDAEKQTGKPERGT